MYCSIIVLVALVAVTIKGLGENVLPNNSYNFIFVIFLFEMILMVKCDIEIKVMRSLGEFWDLQQSPRTATE